MTTLKRIKVQGRLAEVNALLSILRDEFSAEPQCDSCSECITRALGEVKRTQVYVSMGHGKENNGQHFRRN